MPGASRISVGPSMIASLLRRDPEVGASTERMTSRYLEGDLY
jgi:hypothetical protein